jgi:hypothetical protein
MSKEDETNVQMHSRLIPLVEWPKHHPWPPVGGLRHMVFHGEDTGFSRVIKKCNRRILIDEKKFFEFVEEKNLEKAPKPQKEPAEMAIK